MNTTRTHPKPESLMTMLRAFPRPVWILFVGVFLNKFGTFVLPFLAIYLTRRGFSNAPVGLDAAYRKYTGNKNTASSQLFETCRLNCILMH